MVMESLLAPQSMRGFSRLPASASSASSAPSSSGAAASSATGSASLGIGIGGGTRAQRRLNALVLSALIVVLVSTGSLVLILSARKDAADAADSAAGNADGPRSVLVTARTGAVASENKLCSDIGVDALKQGGSSVDAAIATALCIGVTNSFSSGIGGGGFMLLRNTSAHYQFIDFRETAPAAAHVDMYKDDPKKATVGGLSIGIPGELRGYEAAHTEHGKLPWSDLFDGAIRVAQDGWRVNAVMASRLETMKDLVLGDPAGFGADFAPEGIVLKEGELVRRPRIARTLRKLAEKGAKEFYEGEIATSLLKTIKKTGGIITKDDLATYKVRYSEPLVGYYHGRKVVTASTPSSGAMLLSILNIIEGFDFRAHGNTSDTFHLLIEAFKFGAAQRGLLGDRIDPIYRNISSIEHAMIHKDLAALIRHNISIDATFEPSHYMPRFQAKEDHGTMHISVLHKDGSAVALTSTVNLIFGSQIMDPETGIILNDEMDDFSIPGVPNSFGLAPSPYNFIHPSKRPLSSMVPTILERDGAVEVVIGASGGSMIPTCTLATLLNMIDFGLPIHDAIDRPRFHHQLFPNRLTVENAFSLRLGEALEAKGHVVDRLLPGQKFVGVSGIRRFPDGLMTAASDMRKGGVAAGY
ncbi:gamma-glutamyltranspeptidase-domain-containing protein [Chytriomyces sp. MP71]|nr:gamma-glutamyltranspeptidase-domain-containing protein [Chytriomyces sp. MP71]